MLRLSFKSWLGSWQEWGITILLFLVLEVAIVSIEQARWITPQPSLTLVLAMAVLSGWLLCKSRLPAIVLHPVAIVLGAAVTVWQASSLFPSMEATPRVKQLGMALQSWWQAVNTAQPSDGTIQFAVLLIFFTWIIGYISTWFVLKRQNAWVAFFLSAVTILINLGNLPEEKYAFFFFYLLAAMLLVGITNLAKRYYQLKRSGISYPKRGIIYLITSLLLLNISVVSIAWLTPNVRVEALETLMGTKMVLSKDIKKPFDNFLAAVPAKLPFLGSDEKRSLLFGNSSFDRGNQLQFVVDSEQPIYWQTRMYDIYNSLGWISGNTTEHILEQGSRNNIEAGETSKHKEMTYTVVPKVKTDILLTGGEFVSSSIPVSVQTLAALGFGVENRTTPGSTETDAELSGINLTQTQPAGDIVTVSSLYTIWPERRYTVTTRIISPISGNLSEAADAYPPWVTDHYLQLPPTLPKRVGRLSETITKDAKTSYDKVLAIKEYLTHINYLVEAKAPPDGVDGVDHFLFTQRSGNCVQFASSMAVMLRAIGIPSRISIGYAPGEWDAETGRTSLTTKERHTWPEVYFTGHGWVGFEATPGVNGAPAAIDVIDSLGSLSTGGADEEDIGGGNSGIGGQSNPSDKGLALVQFLANGANLLVMLLMAVGTIISILLGVWLFLPRRREYIMRPDYASEIYRKMCFLASLVRLSPRPQQTPLEYSARLASVFPLQAEALGNIVQTYVERRYSARKEMERWQIWRLQQSWHDVRPRLIRQLFRIRH